MRRESVKRREEEDHRIWFVFLDSDITLMSQLTRHVHSRFSSSFFYLFLWPTNTLLNLYSLILVSLRALQTR